MERPLQYLLGQYLA